ENIKLGKGTVRPVTKYSAFKALFFNGSLLGCTEIERIKAGAIVVAAIKRQGVGEVVLEATPTAYTTFEKTSLVLRQKAEGREGEVWTKRNCAYTGGKGHKTDTVRTKYLIEVEVIITGIEKSTADGRTVAAFVVRDLSGKPVGKVGTGFDDATARKLAARHRVNPGSVRIHVIAQGWTETGRLWHARFNNRV
ncbi:MAG: ATP-dependent DNA ligase, partial [Verrucomicrobiota bacterium]